MSNFHVIVLVAFAVTCQCRTIDEDILQQQKSETVVSAVACEEDLNYGGWPQTDPNETIEGLSVKQKRCPSTLPRLRGIQNFQGNEVLGASAPVGLQTRGAPPYTNEKMCAICQSRPLCKVQKKCDSCKIWCIKKDRSSFEVDDSFLPHEKNAPLESINNVPMSFSSRFGDTSSESLEDVRVSQSAIEGGKRVYTIANFSSGSKKEEISKLLGVSDVSDIDKLLVWVTTFSNMPPKFDNAHTKNVSPATEEMTQALNEELAPEEDVIGGTHHPSLPQDSHAVLKTTSRFGSKEEKSIEPSTKEDLPELNEEDEVNTQLGQNTLRMKTTRPNSIIGSAIPDDKEEFQPVVDQKAYRKPLTKVLMQDLQNKLEQTLKGAKQYIDNQKNKIPDKIPELKQKRPFGKLTPAKMSGDDESNVNPTIGTNKETSQPETNKPIISFDPRLGAKYAEEETEDEILSEPESYIDQKIQRQPLPDQSDSSTGSKLSSRLDVMEDDIQTKKQIQQMKNKLGQSLKKLKPADTKLVNTEDEKQILGKPKSKTSSESNMLSQGEDKADPFVGSEADDKAKVDVDRALGNINNKGTFSPITKKLMQQIQDKLEQRLKNLDENIIKAKSPTLEIPENFPNKEKILPRPEANLEKDKLKLKPLDSITGSPQLSEPNIKSKDDTTLEKEDPVTNNLLKQLKEKMDQRLKSTLPRYQDIQIGKSNPNSFKLARKENLKHQEKEIESESFEDQDSSRELNHTPQKLSKAEDSRKSIVGKLNDNFVEENLQQFQSNEMAENDRELPKLLQSEVPRSRLMSPDNNQVQDISSNILKYIDKGVQLEPEVVDNFDGAQKALENVEDLVDEITKDTNIKLGKEPSILEMANAEEEEQTIEDKQLLGFPTRKKFHTMFKKPFKSTLFGNGILGRQNELKDEKLGSQPAEEVPWDTNMPPNRVKEMNLGKSKTNSRLGLPVTEGMSSVESKETKIPEGMTKDAASTEDESSILRSRAEFSEEDDHLKGSPWSKSLGNLMPLEAEQAGVPVNPNDMYFVGNGIKLPLQMIHKKDGAVHLSVDLDKLCSCKNVTCEGHAAGAILAKTNNPESNDELEGVNQRKNSRDERRTGPYERKATHTWLGMKNKIARHLDPNEEYEQDVGLNVFKRSTGKTFENTIESDSETKSKLKSSKLNTNIHTSLIPRLNKKILNTIHRHGNKGQNTESHSMQENPKKMFKTVPKQISESIELNSRPNTILKNKENSKFTVPTHLIKTDKFKKNSNLQNKVEQNVDGSSKSNDNRSRKNSFIKEEVDIMNNVLTFLKTLSSDKTVNRNKYII